MPAVLPMGLKPGAILQHARFYVDRDTGEFKPKFLLMLASCKSGDIVIRLLTSRPHGRLELPRCYHGHPYPGFYLGVLGPPLGKKSWVDLRGLDDADSSQMVRLLATGDVKLVTQLAADVLRTVSECVAAAEDTTVAQERAIRDQIAAL